MRTAWHSGRNRVVMPTYQLGASPLNFLVPGTRHSCPPQTDFAKIIFNVQSLAQVIVCPVCSVSSSHFSRSSLCLPFSILIYASGTWSVCITSTGSLALGLLIGLGQWQMWQEMREWGGRLQYVGSPLSHPHHTHTALPLWATVTSPFPCLIRPGGIRSPRLYWPWLLWHLWWFPASLPRHLWTVPLLNSP